MKSFKLTSMKLLFQALLMMGFAMLTVGCSKECDECPKPAAAADTTRPVIILNSPALMSTFTGGTMMNVNIKVEDDRELSQVKIAIHDNFDGHSHGRLSDAVTPFEFDTIISTSARELTINFDVMLPSNIAAGAYHFTVEAIDKSGNQANFVEANLTMVNPEDNEAPLIALVIPDFNVAEIDGDFAVGQDTIQVRLIGTLTDSKNGGNPGELKGYEILFYEASHGHKTAGEDESKPVYKLSNFNITGSIFNMDATLILRRSDLENNGEYKLKVAAYDAKNNKRDVEVKYHIHMD
jgi:ACT domain-containing protein